MKTVVPEYKNIKITVDRGRFFVAETSRDGTEARGSPADTVSDVLDIVRLWLKDQSDGIETIEGGIE